ncbi:MAG TPA: hypothetical protein VF746_02990 [Longimicrobium sp.]|jgi:Cu2+-containing amine oxidase
MRAPTICRAAGAAVLLALGSARAAAAQPCSTPYLVQHTFTGGGKQTEWMLCWQTPTSWGLVITAAFFRPAPTRPWIRVFWDARVSEIFVPYHNGVRFYDLTDYIKGPETLGAGDCPAAAGGTLLAGVVCKEVHDRGIAWKSHTAVRRGQELVLWGSFKAVNYRYLIRWTFRDDGVVLGEMAATGSNLPWNWPVSHTHDAMWRLDIDLNGWAGDNVHRTVHAEVGTGASDTAVPVASEQPLDWSATEFTHLHVFDGGLKNGRGSVTGYMLMPVRTGSSRHDEAWTGHDAWVTRYDPSEMRPRFLPHYVAPAQSTASTDVVVWYWGPLHHMYRDEDGNADGGEFEGVAQTMWTGFILKPQNLFDGPPFYP